MTELNNTKNLRGGWFQLDNILVDEYASKIGYTPLAIYICIKRHVNNEEGYAWPSHKVIAAKLCMHERTVSRNIEILESYNLVIRERKRRYGQWANYSYTLTDREEWTLLPHDKKSPSHVTNSTPPYDKNDGHQMTQSPIKNTNNINTNNKKTEKKKNENNFSLVKKEEKIDGRNTRIEQIGTTLMNRYEIIPKKESTNDSIEDLQTDNYYCGINLDDIPF